MVIQLKLSFLLCMTCWLSFVMAQRWSRVCWNLLHRHKLPSPRRLFNINYYELLHSVSQFTFSSFSFAGPFKNFSFRDEDKNAQICYLLSFVTLNSLYLICKEYRWKKCKSMHALLVRHWRGLNFFGSFLKNYRGSSKFI